MIQALRSAFIVQVLSMVLVWATVHAAHAEAVRDLTPPVTDLLPQDPRDAGVKPDTDTTGTEPAKTEDNGRTGGSGHSSSSSDDDVTQPPEFQTRHFGAQIALACRLGDAPGSIVLVNQSEEMLPSGTRIKWQFRQTRAKGYFALIGSLRPGGTLVADDVLRQGQSAAGDCVARIL